MIKRPISVTRIVNSCTLLELGDDVVLTDPWFTERWHLHHGEPLGRTVEDLPALTAIVGSHHIPNHWDIGALGTYPHKRTTQVVVSDWRMARAARKVGFERVHHIRPGQHLRLSDGLELDAIGAGAPFRVPNNNYVLSGGGSRVLFGGEARDLEPLAAYRAEHPPVDLCLLPVNGIRVRLGPRLVMTARTAVQATAAVGAETLIPIHDAQHPDLPWAFLHRESSTADAVEAATDHPGVVVVPLATGQRWIMPERD